jgi:hypothetical protein
MEMIGTLVLFPAKQSSAVLDPVSRCAEVDLPDVNYA